MKKESYSKLKDSSPSDTIYQIQSILHELQIDFTYEFTGNQYDSCYSTRVTLTGTTLGQNGKGTTPLYALASGYAELMERIQNNMFSVADVSPDDLSYGGFTGFPESKYLPFSELSSGNPFMDRYFAMYPVFMEQDKRNVLNSVIKKKDASETALCTPFADIFDDRIVYLPNDIVNTVYVSNGMAAGNTMEEALVQGFSEIFERYVNKKIALESVCPPDVPREALEVSPV